MPNGTPAKVADPPKFEDLTPAQQEALADKANELGLQNEGHEVSTSYRVVLTRDGAVALVTDEAEKFVLDREATAEDILGSAAVVQATVTAQMTASTTQQVMLAQARAMATQQQHAQEVQQMRGMNLLRS